MAETSSRTHGMTMRWLKPEYLLKGLFLGLLVYAAVREGEAPAATPTETLSRLV